MAPFLSTRSVSPRLPGKTHSGIPAAGPAWNLHQRNSSLLHPSVCKRQAHPPFGPWRLSLNPLHPNPGVANFFCKRWDSKILRICRTYSLCHKNSILPLSWEGSHRQKVSKWGCLCANKILWTLKFELHLIFTSPKIFFYFCFFNHLKRCKS